METIKVKTWGAFTFRAKAVPVNGGYFGAIVITVDTPKSMGKNAVVCAKHGVGRQHVFTSQRAAIDYAFEVGRREVFDIQYPRENPFQSRAE